MNFKLLIFWRAFDLVEQQEDIGVLYTFFYLQAFIFAIF